MFAKSAMSRLYLASALALSSPAAANDKKPENIALVDMHAVFAVDLSGSVDMTERIVIMEGFAKALTSKEAMAHFDSGLHYALSAVFFADYAEHTVTEIVHNSREAAAFADKVFWDFKKNEPRPVPSVGTKTNILSAYKTAARLYNWEEAYGFKAQARSMIVAGDGKNDQVDRCPIDCWTVKMAQDHNAVVYGIPIVTNIADAMRPDGAAGDLISYFARNVVTPPGLYYQSPEGFKVPVKPGNSHPAVGFSAMEKTVTEALRLSLF